MMGTSILRRVISLLLILSLVYFFYIQIDENWIDLRQKALVFNFSYMLLALLLVILAYIIATIGWQISILKICNKRLTFPQSISLVNISQISKYIPGKLWSYAFQMYLLSKYNISMTLVASVNLIMMLSLILSAALIGVTYILYSGAYIANSVAVFLLVVILISYLLLIFSGSWFINKLIRLINLLLNKNVDTLKLNAVDMFNVHFLYLISNVFFGLSGYFVGVALGLQFNTKLLYSISSTVLLADAIGFVAFFVPGGLGVREGLIYSILKSSLDITTCVVFPLAFRLITISGDFLLGILSLFLLTHFKKDFNFIKD